MANTAEEQRKEIKVPADKGGGFYREVERPVWHGTSKCYENDKDTRIQGLSECSEAEGSPMIGVDTCKVLAAMEERTRMREEKEAQRRQRLEEPGPSVYERVWSTE